MTVNDKNKTIDSKTEQNKDNLDRQTAKISALSSGYVRKYEFLTGEVFYLKKSCYNFRLQKPATIKRF